MPVKTSVSKEVRPRDRAAAREGFGSKEVSQILRHLRRRRWVLDVTLLLMLARSDSHSVLYHAPREVMLLIVLEVWASRRDNTAWPVRGKVSEKCEIA